MADPCMVTLYADLITLAAYKLGYKQFGSEAYELHLLRDCAPGMFIL